MRQDSVRPSSPEDSLLYSRSRKKRRSPLLTATFQGLPAEWVMEYHPDNIWPTKCNWWPGVILNSITRSRYCFISIAQCVILATSASGHICNIQPVGVAASGLWRLTPPLRLGGDFTGDLPPPAILTDPWPLLNYAKAQYPWEVPSAMGSPP